MCVWPRVHIRMICLISDVPLTSTCENDFDENNNAKILWKEGGGCVISPARKTQSARLIRFDNSVDFQNPTEK